MKKYIDNIELTLSELDLLLINFTENIEFINNINNLKEYKSKYIGKKSFLNLLIKNINKFNIKNKIILGKKINYIKNKIYDLYIDYKKKILHKLNYNLKKLDIYLPGRKIKIGSLHPISLTILEIEEYFNNLGFETNNYLEIEESYYNFDALNIPNNHPSRSNKDTFWINDFKLLRTQTSCSQIRFLKKNKPPIKIISYGKVYRNDKDRTHSPMFHQLDGFIIDKFVNLKLLKNILEKFIKYFFIKNKKLKIRFRPSYFPFTEPSIEIDILNINNKWMEILGCGLIHPKVLKNLKINTNKYSGLAFGIGIERLIMLRYNISDLKVLFENNIRFLDQFSYMR